ncbi:monocarboxylate transporter 12-like [Glandiceps talaboti]
MKRRSRDEHMATREEDGGIYGWLLVLSCHVCCMLVFGTYQAIGPVFVELQRYFNAGSARTSWILSVATFTELTFGPVANISVKKIGYRGTVVVGGILSSVGFVLSAFAPNLEFLYFSFGLLTGIGYGLVLTPQFGIVPLYLKKRYILANALTVCGSGSGAFAFTPLLQLLIDWYGWRGAFIVFAAINANLCICGVFFRDPKILPSKLKVKMRETESVNDILANQHDGNQMVTNKRTTMQKICQVFDCSLLTKYPTFTLISFVYFLSVGVAFPGMPPHTIARAQSKNLGSNSEIALVMSIFGIMGIMGRLMTPAILRFKFRALTSVRLYGWAFICTGLTTLLSSLADSYAKYSINTAFLGLFSGIFFCLVSQSIKDVVGSTNLTAGIAVSTPFGGIGGLIGAPIGGWIYDITKDYNNAFYFYGSCMVCAGLALLILQPFTDRCQNEKRAESDEIAPEVYMVEMTSVGTNTE